MVDHPYIPTIEAKRSIPCVPVISPNMYNSKLWETSGHWQNYKDDMFTLDVEKEKWALKPMNCPGHCIIFDSRDRSYKELPIRMAEFGIIHRNEASGALTGLTRVRRFVQDDTHVFCMPSQVRIRSPKNSDDGLNECRQVEEEISRLFDFMEFTYGLFGFEFSLELSTRPDNYLGHIETWNEAESVSHFSPSPPRVSSALGLAQSFPTPTDSPNTRNRATALALLQRINSNSRKRWKSTTLETGKLTRGMERFTVPR